MSGYSGCDEAYEIALKGYKALDWEMDQSTKDDSRYTKDPIWMLVIVNGILSGKTWTAMAADLGVSRRTLYNFRQRVELWDFVNSLMDEQLIDIAKAKADGDIATALKFRNQLLLALTPRRVRQSIEADAKVEFVYTVEEPDAEGGDAVQATP